MVSESIKQKIAALLKMTSASGCTEAEAMAAAKKAAELMREYGLSESDITIGQASVNHHTKGRSARDELWSIVAFCTNTAPTIRHVPGKHGAELIFVGRDPGPEVAAYLVEVLNRALDTAIAEFKAGPFYVRRRTQATRRAAAKDFTQGMVRRLANRLLKIFGPTISKDANAIAMAAREQRFEGAKAINRAAAKTRFDDAIWSGWVAGSRVNLAQGVNGSAITPRQIGCAS